MKPVVLALLVAAVFAAPVSPARAQHALAGHDLSGLAAHEQDTLTVRELRGSMLDSDSIEVARVIVDVVETPGPGGVKQSRLATRKVWLNHLHGPWMKRFVAQFLPPQATVRAELCPTPRALPGQDKPWMVSVLWINGVRERGQAYVDLANLCGFAGLMGRMPLGVDVDPARADSLFALFQQALYGDSALKVMKLPPLAASKPVAGLGDQPPQVSVRVAPAYPDSARRAGAEGTVSVRALVGADGGVQEAHVLKGVFGLDLAAVEAVKQWRFKPAMRGSTPVAAWVVVPVKFELTAPASDPKPH